MMALALTLGLLFGQNQGGATIVQTPQAPYNEMPQQTSMGPIKAQAANQHDVKIHGLTTDSFVVVKDVGDSQVVMVYKVDASGKVSLTHKARFFY